MVAPDNDPSNLRGVYDVYEDSTGTPSPLGAPKGQAVGVRHIREQDYEALADTDISGNVVYVTTGEPSEEE